MQRVRYTKRNYVKILLVFLILTSLTLFFWIYNGLILWQSSISTVGYVQNARSSTSMMHMTTTARLPYEELLALDPKVDHSPALSEEAALRLINRFIHNLPVAYWQMVATNSTRRNQKSKNSHSTKRQFNSSCANLPKVYDLKFKNIYWQIMISSNGTYNFYAAYLDDRAALSIGRNSRGVVRILVMIDRIRPTLATYCQLWMADRAKPVIVPVFEYKYLWNSKWGNFRQGILQPYLMACRVPGTRGQNVDDETWKPLAVSVVEHKCSTATVLLRVIDNRPVQAQSPTSVSHPNLSFGIPNVSSGKQEFAVCVKGLSFPTTDLSVRLVEWLELLRILGASKVFIYEMDIHPNISKVLAHYQKSGYVDVRKLTLAGEQPNYGLLRTHYLQKHITHKRQSELIPYNDCLYRNMNLYEYLVLMDIDEVIMPVAYDSWSQLMAFVKIKSKLALQSSNDTASKKKNVYASYNTRNVYFFDRFRDNETLSTGANENSNLAQEVHNNVPRYMHILQHVHRSANYTKPGHYVKCFHRTDRAISLHNHFPLSCFGGCQSYAIETSDAHLQHYRADCVSTLRKDCNNSYRRNYVLDNNVWRFKDDLVIRTTRTLVELKFLPPSGEQLVELIESGRSGSSSTSPAAA